MSTYPNTPGFKEQGGTSQEAAEHMLCSGKAKILRARCEEYIKSRGVLGSSADECAAALGEIVLAVRPRFSELVEAGDIRKTKLTVKNESGRNAALCVHRSFYAG